MGFNRVTWTPGHERMPITASRFGQVARLRKQRETHALDRAAASTLEGFVGVLSAIVLVQTVAGWF